MPNVIALPYLSGGLFADKQMDFSMVSYQSEDRGRLYTFGYTAPTDFPGLGLSDPVLLGASYQTVGAGHETVASTRDIEVIEAAHSWHANGWPIGYCWIFWIPWPWHFEELPRLRAIFMFGDRVTI